MDVIFLSLPLINCSICLCSANVLINVVSQHDGDIIYKKNFNKN